MVSPVFMFCVNWIRCRWWIQKSSAFDSISTRSC